MSNTKGVEAVITNNDIKTIDPENNYNQNIVSVMAYLR